MLGEFNETAGGGEQVWNGAFVVLTFNASQPSEVIPPPIDLNSAVDFDAPADDFDAVSVENLP